MQILDREVDRRPTGHLQPRNTRKSFLGRRPGVTWFPERASFLARVLFYGVRARIYGSGSPGFAETAGAPENPSELNPVLGTHVPCDRRHLLRKAPSVRTPLAASTVLLKELSLQAPFF